MKNNREAVRLALDTILKRKAIVYETVALQHNFALSDRYPQIKEVFDKLRLVRTKLARLILSGPDDSECQEQYNVMLAQLENEQDMLEDEIAKQVPLIELRLRMQNADIDAIVKALPVQSALVEIIRFTPYNFEAIGVAEQQEPDRYIAFVMMEAKRGQIEMVDLGAAAEIEKLVKDFESLFVAEDETRGINNMSAGTGELREVYRNLYDTLFQPLINKLQEKELPDDLVQVIIAPDGELFKVPFETFLSSHDRFVVEDFEISYVTVGRDLVRTGEGRSNSGTVVVVADPDYNLMKSEELKPDGERAECSDNEFLQRSYLHRQLSSKKNFFDLLPGTRVEGNSLIKLLNSKRIKVAKFFGSTALERWIKIIEQPLILHIATHGFYFSDQDKLVREHLFGLVSGKLESVFDCFKKHVKDQKIENPFLRSGLALAGVNTVFNGGQVPDEAEDGILTALDVLTLDLINTELVTLSACQTGLGEIRYGEGVIGLRKSFILAGAKTLVVSLWSVPDYETRWLMEEFYKWILEGEDKSKALRKAKLKLIENMRKKNGFADPCYWAGFICQGDTGPLYCANIFN